MPPTSSRPVSRRRFVASTAGVAGLVMAGGCALPPVSDEPDPLLELARSARRDALELGAADASHGGDVARLRRVADIRRIHARRVDELLAQHPPADAGDGGDEDNGDGLGPREESRRAAAVCPPLDEVRSRLRADARRAAEVAGAAGGYRAELAAAVSAACTAAVEVELA